MHLSVLPNSGHLKVCCERPGPAAALVSDTAAQLQLGLCKTCTQEDRAGISEVFISLANFKQLFVSMKIFRVAKPADSGMQLPFWQARACLLPQLGLMLGKGSLSLDSQCLQHHCDLAFLLILSLQARHEQASRWASEARVWAASAYSSTGVCCLDSERASKPAGCHSMSGCCCCYYSGC